MMESKSRPANVTLPTGDHVRAGEVVKVERYESLGVTGKRFPEKTTYFGTIKRIVWEDEDSIAKVYIRKSLGEEVIEDVRRMGARLTMLDSIQDLVDELNNFVTASEIIKA